MESVLICRRWDSCNPVLENKDTLIRFLFPDLPFVPRSTFCPPIYLLSPDLPLDCVTHHKINYGRFPNYTATTLQNGFPFVPKFRLIP